MVQKARAVETKLRFAPNGFCRSSATGPTNRGKSTGSRPCASVWSC